LNLGKTARLRIRKDYCASSRGTPVPKIVKITRLLKKNTKPTHCESFIFKVGCPQEKKVKLLSPIFRPRFIFQKLKLWKILFMLLFVLSLRIEAEPLRLFIAGEAEISLDKPEGTTISLSYTDTVLIRLRGDIRFFRGIQFDLTAPQAFLAYYGSLASSFYAELNGVPPPRGTADVNARQLSFEALPNKILNTWQIPLRPSHGLRSSPYVIIPTGIVPPASFPMLFRLMPVIKGISDELEKMVFQLQVKPILSDEGAVKISFSYPEQLHRKPVSVLIDDEVVIGYEEELLLKEGEHHLLILSEDYRNQSRRFLVERAKVLILHVELQDPTPLLIFEHPEGVRVLVNSIPVNDTRAPYPVESGIHEVRFEMSNYSISRSIIVQKGKTYRIAMSVDVNITEND
jgi:hypothetical protein